MSVSQCPDHCAKQTMAVSEGALVEVIWAQLSRAAGLGCMNASPPLKGSGVLPGITPVS